MGTIAPGVAFFVAESGRFEVVDRTTGELLGTIWRARDSTWSVSAPDGSFLAANLRGTRQDIGLWLQHQIKQPEETEDMSSEEGLPGPEGTSSA